MENSTTSHANTSTEKVKRVWVPGFEKRLAAGSNGVLYRFRKTTRTLEPLDMGGNPYKAITLRHGATDKIYPYAYLIALAFLDISKAPQTEDPNARPRVGFADGNRLNTRPENLYWLPTGWQLTLDRVKAREALNREIVLTRDDGEFRQLQEAHGYYVKDDGTLWKRQANGNLKQKRPTFRKDGTLLVSLPPTYSNYLPLKEIIADIYLSPRPTPKHRARQIDGNPLNTKPHNLRWVYSITAPPYPHTMTAADPSRRYAFRSQESNERRSRTMDAFIAIGARRLKTDLNLWVTRDGLIYYIDQDTGMKSLIRPSGGRIHIAGGFLDSRARKVYTSSNRGITAGNMVFDAFPELTAEAAKHPDAPNIRRAIGQTTYPKDGNPDNTHPSNLLLTASPNSTKWFHFLDYDGDTNGPLPSETVDTLKAETAAHSETMQTTPPDDSPLDLDTFLD